MLPDGPEEKLMPTTLGGPVTQNGSPLVGPARRRPLEMLGKQNMGDLVRQRSVQDSVERPPQAHQLPDLPECRVISGGLQVRFLRELKGGCTRRLSIAMRD